MERLLRGSFAMWAILWGMLVASPSAAAVDGAVEPIVVRVAIPGAFPPQYSLDDTGKPSGFAVDIFEQLAGMANLRPTYLVKDNWEQAQAALRTGEVDVIPNMGMTERRKAFADFTSSVETFPVSIFVREMEEEIQGEKDLVERRVAVIKVNVGYTLLKDRPEVRLVLYEHRSDILFALLSGQVDALVYPEPLIMMDANMAGLDDRIKVVGKPLKEIKRGIAVAKGRKELLDRLEPAVKAFVGTEEYKRIYTKWYGTPKPYWTSIKVATFLSATFFGTLGLMFLWRYRSLSRLNLLLRKEIRERERAENELLKAHLELKNLDRTKSMLLSSVSHELRTPLTSLIGFAKVSIKKMETYVRPFFTSADDIKARKAVAVVVANLKTIAAEGDHLTCLVRNIMDMTELVSGDLTLHKIPVPYAGIIEQVVAAHRAEADSKGLWLCTEIAPDAPQTIWVDAARLTQVLHNLVSNALKFTSRGGIDICVESDQDAVLIRVRDTGVGIPHEVYGLLFQSFNQVGDTLTSKPSGLGLGLAISRQLVELHGGRLWLESEPGRGSTFCFTLPL